MTIGTEAFSEEAIMFEQMVQDFMQREFPSALIAELEARVGTYPQEIWDALTRGGFHGLGVPEEWGGSGAGTFEQAIFMRHLAKATGGLSWTWATTAFAGARPISEHGSESQKRTLLPEIASGNCRVAIGVTEPQGGTDVLGTMRTSARRTDNGWVLTGSKTWCTGSADSDYILVLATTEPDMPKPSHGRTLFLVPMAAPGVSTQGLPKLGMRGLGSYEVFFDDVALTDADRLGSEGRGFHHLLGALNFERVIVAALSLGILDAVVEDACRYSLERTAFGKPIGQFQSIQNYLADMRVDQAASEALLVRAARQVDGADPDNLTLIAKIYTSEAAVRGADRGIQILGGMGYSTETSMQRYWRDARLYMIAPLTNEVARSQLAQAMGMPRSY